MSVAVVTESGVDTVSFAFRPQGRDWFDAVECFRAKAHRHGAAGSLIADSRPADGGRLLAFPAHGALVVESRLAAMLAGSENDHALCALDRLPVGAEVARRVLAAHLDVDPGDHVEVRRSDLAAGLRFKAAADGIAFLRGVASMTAPRLVTTIWKAVDGVPMTVYFKTPRRGAVVARIYDKGRESGCDPPGEHVRIEVQVRPPKSQRQSPQVVATEDHRERFGRVMSSYTGEELTVAGPDGAVAELAARAVRGELTHAKAERLIGSVALLKHGGRAVYDRADGDRKVNDRRSSRRIKALRDAGISLDEALPASALIPVTGLLREAIERFAS